MDQSYLCPGTEGGLTFIQASGIVADLPEGLGPSEMLLLSDQCRHRVDMTVDGRNVASIGGSLLMQLSLSGGAARALAAAVGCRIPAGTLEEAVENAIIHRDYSSPERTEVRIGSDGVTVESPGTAAWDSARNAWLSDAASSAGLVANPGRGAVIIKDGYARAPCNPLLSSRNGCFTCFLPSVNGQPGGYQNRIRKVTDYMRGRGGVEESDVADALSISRQYAKTLLDRMVEDGMALRLGNGPCRRYYLCGRRDQNSGREATMKISYSLPESSPEPSLNIPTASYSGPSVPSSKDAPKEPSTESV